MTPIPAIASVAPTAAPQPAASGFDRHLGDVARSSGVELPGGPAQPESAAPAASRFTPPSPGGAAAPHARPVASVEAAAERPSDAGRAVEALVEQAVESRRALDAMIDAARDGRTWSPGELLAVQSAVHRHAARLELTGKVVEQASRSVRTLLETRV